MRTRTKLGLHLLVLTLTLALGVTPAPTARAGLRVTATECVKSLLKRYVVHNLEGSDVDVLVESGASPVTEHLKFTKRIGTGTAGSAYLVDGATLPGVPRDAKVVAKTGNLLPWQETDDSVSLWNKFVEDESREDRLLHDAMARLRADPAFPKDFGWADDPSRLPVAEIYGRGHTPGGSAVLFKRYVHGLSPAEVVAKYGAQLPPELNASLRNIYDLAQAVHRQVRLANGRPFMLDIYPSNLIWVESPEDLKTLGLRKPSFIMPEAAAHPTEPFTAEKYPFSKYVDDFKSYARTSAPEKPFVRQVAQVTVATERGPPEAAYDGYLEYRAEALKVGAAKTPETLDQVVTPFYRDNYKGRNIVIFSDDELGKSSGFSVMMRIIKEKIEKKTGMNVVFVTPSSFKRHFPVTLQGQTFNAAMPTDAEIGALLQQYNPAAVHIMSELAVGNRAEAALARRGIPFTTAYHTEWPGMVSSRVKAKQLNFVKPVLEEMVNKYLRRFHAKADTVMVPSQSLVDQLAVRKFETANLRPWVQGVDIEQFTPALRDETLYPRLAAAQGKVAKPPYVVMVSRYSDEKNVSHFLDLQLKSGGTKVFVGPGVPEEIKAKYPDVLFLGNKNQKTEIPALYASADAFVFPGTREALQLVTGESLASGTPVVAYKVRGPADVVTDPRVGVLVKYDEADRAGDVERLSGAVDEALKLDRKNVRSFAENMSWDSSITQFLSYLFPLR